MPDESGNSRDPGSGSSFLPPVFTWWGEDPHATAPEEDRASSRASPVGPPADAEAEPGADETAPPVPQVAGLVAPGDDILATVVGAGEETEGAEFGIGESEPDASPGDLLSAVDALPTLDPLDDDEAFAHHDPFATSALDTADARSPEPSILDGEAEAVAPEPLTRAYAPGSTSPDGEPAADLADRLEALAAALRSGGLDALTATLDGSDRLSAILAGVLAGYLAARDA